MRAEVRTTQGRQRHTTRSHERHRQYQELRIAAIPVERRASRKRPERNTQRERTHHRTGKHAKVFQPEMLRHEVGDHIDLRTDGDTEDRRSDRLTEWIATVEQQERARDDRQ
jgi:hypothetical protein